jgi:short-subunit dehydrogenase
MRASSFHENCAIITGATSGIGRALAHLLAREGAWLALAARDAAQLTAVAAECQAAGGRALAIPTDVADEAQCRRLAQETLAAYGRIDTLVNNAGISMWARFEDMQTLAPFEEVIRVNYLGSVYCTYYALAELKRNRGRLVAVSSLAGKSGVPTRSGYAASKHAMVGFFDTLRIELALYGVSVTIAYPDFVASQIRTRAFGPDGSSLGQSPIQEGKVMTAETCAGLILEGMARRKREIVMGRRGQIGQWLKLIAPGLVDRIAAHAIAQGK